MPKNDCLLLIWKDPETRRNYTVGKLTRGKPFIFQYGGEAEKAEEAGWKPMGAFPTYQEYRREVAERIGAEEEKKLRMEVAEKTKGEDVQRDKDGDVIRLFYEPASKRYFHATMSRVIEASYYFNRELATNGCISVNEWCNYLCTDELTVTPEGDEMGWCLDQLIYDWDAYWMDFEYDKQITDDGLECYYLAPALDPVKNYLNYEEDTYHA